MAEARSVGEIVQNVPEGRKSKTIGRREFLRKGMKYAAGTGVVAAAAAVGVNVLNQESAKEPLDPHIFDPTAEEGVLTPQNTIHKPTGEALDLIAQQTNTDQKLRFAPPAASAVEYRHVKVAGSDLEYIEWSGFPEGTVINSPYKGKVRLQRYRGIDATGKRFEDEKFDYMILDVQLDEAYNAEGTWANEPVLRFMVPAQAQLQIPKEEFIFGGGEWGTQVSSNQLEIDAGQPLFAIGSSLLYTNHGQGRDHPPHQFHTYFNEIPAEGTKAIILANSQ